MPEADDVIAQIEHVVNTVAVKRPRRSVRRDAAMQMLWEAIHETEKYIELLRSGQPVNRAKEYELSGLWHKAGMKMKAIDPGMASAMSLKGAYWASYDKWSTMKVARRRIKLTQMRNQLHAMIEAG